MSKEALVIIGAGPGGYVAALRAAQLGVPVTLIERERPGGTCLHRGCIPSKALIHGANVLDTIRRAGEYGVRFPAAPTLDFPTLAAKKDKTVAQLATGLEFLLQKRGVKVLSGEAAFTGPKALRLRKADGSSENLEFEHAIIATGSTPTLLPGFPMDPATFITSNEVLKWTALPASIAIVGAGVIGCEFASLFARLGVPVHVVEMLDGALPGFDEDVRKEVARGLKKQSVEFHFETKVEEAAYGPAGATLSLSDGETVSAQVCIVAVGRRPFSEGLDVEKAGLSLGKQGAVAVDSRCRTPVPHIFAIGDVTGLSPFAHAASHMGIVAVEQIAGAARGGRDLEFDPLRVPGAVFTQPEVAAIGLTEAKARESGRELRVGKFPFRALGKAQVDGEIDGFVKLVADAKSGELLGFHAVGHSATDLLGEASLAWQSESSIEDLAEAIHAHPTLPEAIGEAALLALGKGLHSV